MQLKTFFVQDKFGNAMPGALCYVYEHGTTTLVTTLQDAGGMALANPVTADATGAVQVAAPDGVYSVRTVSGVYDRTVSMQFVDNGPAVELLRELREHGVPAYQHAVLLFPSFADAEAAIPKISDGQVIYVIDETFQTDTPTTYRLVLGELVPESRMDYARRSLLAAASGAALIGYLSPGGVAARTLAARLGETAYIADYLDASEPDDTLGIQRAIDAAPDGATIYGAPGAVYRLSKNHTLAPDLYPVRAGNTAGEQPCLLVRGRKNLTLDGRGATLQVGVHGQGALDILQSQGIKITGFTVAGPGNFPPLDGMTGRGEKGITTAGYYDANAVSLGPPRNNSRDTRGYNTGGFGGAFPQLGGGSASTWGAWTGGGYIANFGSAIYIDHGSTDIEITGNEIHGFNEDGIQINTIRTESYGWAGCSGVKIYKNNIRHCYNAGIEYHDVVDIVIEDNDINDCGHPTASTTHTHIDPGYGIASNNGTAPKNVSIRNNRLRRNKRKGIDAHSIDGGTITENTVEDSGYGIMLVNGSLGVVRNVTVANNTVRRISYTAAAQGVGIYVERNAGAAAGFAGNVVVANNQVYEVGVPPGQSAQYPGTNPMGVGIQLSGTLDGSTVSGNLVQNTKYLGFCGLCIGWAGPDTVKGAFSGNSIKGGWTSGINNLASGGTGNSTNGNKIELTSVSPYSGAQTGIKGAADRHFAGNDIVVPAGQSYMSGAAQGVDLIVKVTITNGVISYTTGFNQARFVTGVVSAAFGLQINMAEGIAVQAISISQRGSSPAARFSDNVTLDHIYVRAEAAPAQIGFKIGATDIPANQAKALFTLIISI